MSTTLFAWANALSFATDFDHTWVTSFPTNGPLPIPSGDDYWYCWGVHHSTGNGGIHHNPGGAIGSAGGSTKTASALVLPNTEPPTPTIGTSGGAQGGSITFYGVDGVCHQVANQVLYATGSADTDPLRVKEARGYHLSTFFFANYGLNDEGWDALASANAPDVVPPLDDFDTWIVETMEGALSLRQILEVTAIRTTAQLALQKLHQKVNELSSKEVIAAIAAIVFGALTLVYRLIGKENFHTLFPSMPELPATAADSIAWIDDSMVEGSVAQLKASRP